MRTIGVRVKGGGSGSDSDSECLPLLILFSQSVIRTSYLT